MRLLRMLALCALAVMLCLPTLAATTGCTCNGCPMKAATPDNTLTAQEKAANWTLLFDGKTFNGWGFTDPTPGGWIIKNGAMEYTVKGHAYAYTQPTFGDFEFKADFMVAKSVNSGIFFRWADLGDPVQTGFEMQVLDSAGKTEVDKHDCGALYDALAPSANPMKPAMQWNTVNIICKGSMVMIALNGKRVIVANLDRWTQAHKNPDGTDNKYDKALCEWARAGHIGFQAHGGQVWFKNVKIRQL